MNLYRDISGWTLLFALLICDGFGVWMGCTEIRRRGLLALRR